MEISKNYGDDLNDFSRFLRWQKIDFKLNEAVYS